MIMSEMIICRCSYGLIDEYRANIVQIPLKLI